MIIETILGPMDEALLVRADGELDDDNEHTTWTEYRFNGEIVKRDVHVRLKKWPEGMAAAGGF